MITTRIFGHTADGREVLAFTLQDGASHVTVLNLGGTVQSVVVPDKEGATTDVVLGYDNVEGYEKNGGYIGAMVGRFGNRIEKGRLVLEGKEYSLCCNDNGNHLHGGKVGFDKKIWEHTIDGDDLILSYVSPDGEENYPGTLSVQIKYTFKNGELSFFYRATTDKTTVVNLTNHSYFNLNGAGNGTVLDHLLSIKSKMIVPTDETLIPHGGFRMTDQTPFDFSSPKRIGKDIRMDDIDLRRGSGYDHCFVLGKSGRYRKCAEALGDRTGIRMECFTDLSGVQLYSGNFLNIEGKGGHYGKYAGFAFETEMFPNNVNVPEYALWGSSVLKRGQTFTSHTAYKFS